MFLSRFFIYEFPLRFYYVSCAFVTRFLCISFWFLVGCVSSTFLLHVFFFLKKCVSICVLFFFWKLSSYLMLFFVLLHNCLLLILNVFQILVKEKFFNVFIHFFIDVQLFRVLCKFSCYFHVFFHAFPSFFYDVFWILFYDVSTTFSTTLFAAFSEIFLRLFHNILSKSTTSRRFYDCSTTFLRRFCCVSTTFLRLFNDVSATVLWRFHEVSSTALRRFYHVCTTFLARSSHVSPMFLRRFFHGSCTLLLPRFLFHASSSTLPLPRFLFRASSSALLLPRFFFHASSSTCILLRFLRFLLRFFHVSSHFFHIFGFHERFQYLSSTILWRFLYVSSTFLPAFLQRVFSIRCFVRSFVRSFQVSCTFLERVCYATETNFVRFFHVSSTFLQRSFTFLVRSLWHMIQWNAGPRQMCESTQILDFVLGKCLQEQKRRQDGQVRWKNLRCTKQLKNFLESMEKQLNSSFIFSQDSQHCKFFSRSRTICNARTSNRNNFLTEPNSCQCSTTLSGKRGILEKLVFRIQVYYPVEDFLGIDGEPVELEWNLFPGFTTLQNLQQIQNDWQSENTTPEQLFDRIIFMSMFNDIDSTKKEIMKKFVLRI